LQLPRYHSGVIQNIIFNWSGTLVDDLPAVPAATEFQFRRHAGLGPESWTKSS
jgi:hypothetical protein